MQPEYRNPAAYGNQFIQKYMIPNQRVLKYIYENEDKTFHIIEGQVRSGKTVSNIIKFCQEVEKSPDTIHLTIGISQGAAKTILWESDGLGIAHYPDWQSRIQTINGEKVRFRQRIFKTKYQGHDALALKPKHNSKHPTKYIIAFGGDKANSHDAYTGYSVGTWIATQWELLNPLTREELLKRTFASRNRKHFIDLNPISPYATIYKEFDRWTKENKVNFLKATMQDNPFLLAAEGRIEEVKKEFDPESIEYRRKVLGERASAEGVIYTLRDYNIFNSIDYQDYRKFITVADIGETNSATVFILAGLSFDGKHYDILDYYYHKNAGITGLGVKMPIDYANDYCEFINTAYNKIGILPHYVLSDNDITFVREFNSIKHKYNLATVYLDHTFDKGKINDRIKTGINYLYRGRMRFYYKCDKVIEAFRTATYDIKAFDKGEYVRYDNPQEGTMIDPIDAVEYGFLKLEIDLKRYRGD